MPCRTGHICQILLLTGILAACSLPPETAYRSQLSYLAPKRKPPGMEAPEHTRYLSIENDPERSELTITLGPKDLPAHTSHHALRQLPIQTGVVPFDLMIQGWRMEVVDENGDPVPQLVIHHFNVLEPDVRELFLPIMRRVLAAGSETRPVHVPGWLLGIPWQGGRPFLALTMLHNPTDRSYHNVRVRMIISYTRGKPVYKVYPFHMDVMFPTGTKAFDLPPGPTEKSYEGSPVISGGIIGLGGHLHDYATSLSLVDVTTGQVLYRAENVTDEKGHLLGVPMRRYRGEGLGVPIYPDHRYRVSVTYFNPTGKTIPGGGMGVVAGGFIPFEEWPAANLDDPLYLADYQWVLESLAHEYESGENHKPPPQGDAGR